MLGDEQVLGEGSECWTRFIHVQRTYYYIHCVKAVSIEIIPNYLLFNLQIFNLTIYSGFISDFFLPT